MRICVTGARGFVGRAVTKALQHAGHDVVGISRSGDQTLGIIGVERWTPLRLTPALRDVDAVLHAASIVHRPDAKLDEYVAFNVHGTDALLASAYAAGVKRFVYLSSVKVYGESPHGVVDESTATPADLGYAQTKLDAEKHITAADKDFARGTCLLRLCPVYGIGDKGNVRTMIAHAAKGTLLVPGPGDARKSLIHIDKLTAVCAAMLANESRGMFVVADPYAPTVRELANRITHLLGRRGSPSLPLAALSIAAQFLDKAAALAKRPNRGFANLVTKSQLSTVFSSAKLERELGISLAVDLNTTLRDEIAWLRSERLIQAF